LFLTRNISLFFSAFFRHPQKLQKRAIELNNGRAAMMGILGLMVHELIIPLGYDPELPIIGHLK
jgi:hypothetical protein